MVLGVVMTVSAGYAVAGGCPIVVDVARVKTTDGAFLPLRVWRSGTVPVRKVIVALHGFNDYSKSFELPAPFLTRHGIALYAYDQRGFGEAPDRGRWGGTDRYVEDLRQVVRLVREQHPGIPLFILGDSMGGAVAIVAMTSPSPPDADGVILVAPAVWGRDAMPWYQRWLLAIASRILPGVTVTGSGLGIRPSDNEEMLRALGRDPLVIRETRIDTIAGLVDLMDEALGRVGNLSVPTLWLYGMHDEIIPPEATLNALRRRPPSVRTAFYERGFHMLLRDLHAEEPLTDIVAWIDDHAAPLRFGKGEWITAGKRGSSEGR